MVSRKERVGRKRPRTVPPPPPPRDWREVANELVEREVHPDFGLVLLTLVRAVRLSAEPAGGRKLWPSATARHVAELRAGALAEAPADLRDDLRTLMRLTRRQPPNEVEIAAACQEVAGWLQDAGYPLTACHFAEAGAAVLPEDPFAIFVAARTNRLFGDVWRAETLYPRAIRYAYRQLNWKVYVRAHLGLGRLLSDRGRLSAAARHYYSASRAAKDQGETWLAAQTLHDLMTLFFEAGDYEKAAMYCRKALDTYPLHNERYPVAVHDLAFLLMCTGGLDEALQLLERLFKVPLPPQEQVRVASTLARTAGALGLREQYRAAATRVIDLSPNHPWAYSGFAFLNLAFGARSLGDWELALEYARKGLGLAEVAGQEYDIMVGSQLVKEIAAHTIPPNPKETGTTAGLRELVAQHCEHLNAWRSDGWTAKESQSGPWTLGDV